jgi:hypothetical protein
MALKFHHAYAKIPEDILGVYAYQIIRDQFPQATLDVIVRDIVRVLMFSLLESTLWTNNMGTSLPCDDSMGPTAHGRQVSTTESTHEIQITLRY